MDLLEDAGDRCRGCGRTVDASAEFCPSCGHPVAYGATEGEEDGEVDLDWVELGEDRYADFLRAEGLAPDGRSGAARRDRRARLIVLAVIAALLAVVVAAIARG